MDNLSMHQKFICTNIIFADCTLDVKHFDPSSFHVTVE